MKIYNKLPLGTLKYSVDNIKEIQNIESEFTTSIDENVQELGIKQESDSEFLTNLDLDFLSFKTEVLKRLEILEK